MKSVLNVAIAGLLALGLTANAQTASISNEAMIILQKNKVAQDLLAKRLGVRVGTAAEANVALKKLAPSDQAAVLKAISAYTNNAVEGSSAAAVASNKKAAELAFSVSTGAKVDQVAAAQGKAATAAVQGQTCSQLIDLRALVVPGGVSYATLKAAADKGIIARGSCGEDPALIGDDNKKAVFGRIAECGLNNGLDVNSSEATRINVLGACLAKINNISEEAGKAAINSINNEEKVLANGQKAPACGWFAARFAPAAAMAAKQAN